MVPVAAAPKAARFAGVRVPGSAPAAPVAGTGGLALPRGVPTGGAAGDRRISDAVAGRKVVAGPITWRNCRADPGTRGVTGENAGSAAVRDANGPAVGPGTWWAGDGLLVGRRVGSNRADIGVSRERRTRGEPGAGGPPTLLRTAATVGADKSWPIRGAVPRWTIPLVVTPLVGRE